MGATGNARKAPCVLAPAPIWTSSPRINAPRQGAATGDFTRLWQVTAASFLNDARFASRSQLPPFQYPGDRYVVSKAAAVERYLVNALQNDAAPLSGARILVIEDEFLIATVVEDVLKRAGAREVVIALSPREGRDALAAAEPIDAAVIDIQLAEGNRCRVCARGSRVQALNSDRIPHRLRKRSRATGAVFSGSRVD